MRMRDEGSAMTTVSSPQTVGEGLRKDLATFVENERRRSDVAGAAVAVFDRDAVREAGAFGYADFSRGERVTVDTLFRAASISKTLTTMLVLREIEAGRLALDENVNRYLDSGSQIRDSEGAFPDVTVRHLLTHTSGLPVSWKGLEYGNIALKTFILGTKRPHSLAEVVAGMRTARVPGGPIVYSNGGFALLGYLVSRLHGRPFEDLVRESVLEPLEMRRSGFPIAPQGDGIATSYGSAMGLGRSAGRQPAPLVFNYSGPAGALVTTSIELSRFGRALLRGGELDGRRIVSRELLSDAMRMQAKNHPDLDIGWGLGFEVAELQRRRIVGHGGGLAGVATRIWVMPDEGVGVVVLTNGGDAAFVSRVAERVLESTLGLEPEMVPGSPIGMAVDQVSAWREATKRAVGRYQMIDVVPPGPMTLLMGVVAKPRISHVGQGVLAMDGISQEPVLLYPDGDAGRYRVVSPFANGARAIIEEQDNGMHLWASILHAQKV